MPGHLGRNAKRREGSPWTGSAWGFTDLCRASDLSVHKGSGFRLCGLGLKKSSLRIRHGTTLHPLVASPSELLLLCNMLA